MRPRPPVANAGGSNRFRRSGAVLVVAAHPFPHISVRAFIAAERREIEETVGGGDLLAGALVRRVGVIDRAVLVLVEHALAMQVLHRQSLRAEIVIDWTGFELFLGP